MRRLIYISLVVCVLLSLVFVASASAAPARADRGAWAPGVAYAVNDTVTYAGSTYYCIQAHTSQTGWEPPNVPALWGLVTGTSAPSNTPSRTPTRTSTLPALTNTPTRTATYTNTPLSGSLPDLTITSVTYVGSTPACANNPRDNVVVSNNGNASAGTFVVAFSSQTQTVSGLAAGQSVTLSFSAIPGTVTATADSTNVIAESNESNNSMSASLPAPTQAPTCTPTTGSTTTVTPTRTPTRTATATTSGPGCWAAWVSSTAYNGGAQVSYNGQNYQAAYWTQGDTPDTHSGPAGSGQPWIPMGACGGGGVTNTPTRTPTRTNTPTGPTLTPTRSPTPCTTCGGGLPNHVITGYWQNFNNGATVLRLSSVPTTYNLIAVAFADASGSAGAVVFNIDSGLSSALGGYTNANFTSDVATVHSRGQKVIISVGGQNGTISVSDSSSATNFANSIISLMNNFGFDGVDIDLENGINATYMGQALRSIVASKPGAIITLAPQTIDMQSTGMGYFQLALNIKDILTIVNMQYYNSGAMLGCDQNAPYSQATENFLVALACIQLQNGLRPDQVGLGLPASTSAANGGYVSPSVVNAALDCLAAGTNCGSFHPTSTWPGIRGAMTWSINWDASNGYAWVNAISAHLGSVP